MGNGKMNFVPNSLKNSRQSVSKSKTKVSFRYQKVFFQPSRMSTIYYGYPSKNMIDSDDGSEFQHYLLKIQNSRDGLVLDNLDITDAKMEKIIGWIQQIEETKFVEEKMEEMKKIADEIGAKVDTMNNSNQSNLMEKFVEALDLEKLYEMLLHKLNAGFFLEKIVIKNNKLQKMPNFSELHLKYITINHETLPTILNSDLPKTLEGLDVENCHVRKLDDLSDFSNLRGLYLAKNDLTELPLLPSSLEQITLSRNLWSGRFRKIVRNFRSSGNISQLKSEIAEIKAVQSLPLIPNLQREVFSRITGVNTKKIPYPLWNYRTQKNLKKQLVKEIKNKSEGKSMTRKNRVSRRKTRRF